MLSFFSSLSFSSNSSSSSNLNSSVSPFLNVDKTEKKEEEVLGKKKKKKKQKNEYEKTKIKESKAENHAEENRHGNSVKVEAKLAEEVKKGNSNYEKEEEFNRKIDEEEMKIQEEEKSHLELSVAPSSSASYLSTAVFSLSSSFLLYAGKEEEKKEQELLFDLNNHKRYHDRHQTEIIVENDICFKKEIENLRLYTSKISEDYFALQNVFVSFKNLYLSRILELEIFLQEEIKSREIAENQNVFLEDKCKFLEEQAQAVLTNLQNETDVQALKLELNEEKKLALSVSDSSSSSVLVETPNLEQIIKAREEQLERLASQLNTTNLLYHKQLEESKKYITNIENLRNDITRLENDLFMEKMKRKEIQKEIKQNKKINSYRMMISRSSVPVIIPQIDNSRSQSVASSSLNPPIFFPPVEFICSIKAEIDTVIKGINESNRYKRK